MAASAFGIPSTTPLAAAAEGGLASSSSCPSSASSSSSSNRFSPTFCSEARRGFLRVSSGSPSRRNVLFRVRSTQQASTGIAEPSFPPSEASPSPSSSVEPTVEAGPPTIDLEFLGLEQGQDGLRIADKVSVVSGEKLLRTVMNEQKLELYGLYGKIMNCGGGGSCGTCIVEVLEGSGLLNERTDAEERYLKKKPSTWRLACQTIVGDKTNAGKVVVQRLPQKKK